VCRLKGGIFTICQTIKKGMKKPSMKLFMDGLLYYSPLLKISVKTGTICFLRETTPFKVAVLLESVTL
jgi:hypothetical protein